MMRALIFALGLVIAFGGLSAQTPVWQPSPGHTQLPIWSGAVSDAHSVPGPEKEAPVNKLVADKWVRPLFYPIKWPILHFASCDRDQSNTTGAVIYTEDTHW